MKYKIHISKHPCEVAYKVRSQKKVFGKVQECLHPGSNWGSPACQADGLTNFPMKTRSVKTAGILNALLLFIPTLSNILCKLSLSVARRGPGVFDFPTVRSPYTLLQAVRRHRISKPRSSSCPGGLNAVYSRRVGVWPRTPTTATMSAATES